MEPLEYCRLYIRSVKPEDEGYRDACVEALVEATFGVYSKRSISRWGTQFEHRPDAVLKIIEAAHTINSLHMMLEQISPSITNLLVLTQASQVAPSKQQRK